MNIIPITPEIQAAWDRYEAALAEHRRVQAEKRLKAMGVIA